MSNTTSQGYSTTVNAVYAQLNQRDIEEFYAGYQRWSLQQQIAALQTQIDDLHWRIAENTEHMQEVHPSAIALATLARLQSNGVSDIDLLDRMLEQGELWLDRTMQRLDYFEQLDDFISNDYTQWCQHALEGAYDWIDSVLDGNPSSSPPVATSAEEELNEATEELLLQKLSSDEYEDESSILETTTKRPAITITLPEEHVPTSEDSPIAKEPVPIVVETAPVLEEPALQEYLAPEAPLSIESSSISDNEHPPFQEIVEVSPATEESSSFPPEALLQTEEHAAPEITAPGSEEIEVYPHASIPEANGQHQQNGTPKRPNFIRRLIQKIWGS